MNRTGPRSGLRAPELVELRGSRTLRLFLHLHTAHGAGGSRWRWDLSPKVRTSGSCDEATPHTVHTGT